MTAPDPGLTDLIAAHTPHPDYDCGCGWNGDEWAAHLALVVEQHTNGRITELEATIARVEKLARDMRGWCSPHGISVTYSDRICAVLEGE